MNAATRVITHGEFANSEPMVFRLPEPKILGLMVLVLLSALILVYVKDFNRRLFIDYHQQVAQFEQLQTDNNKLLLEQSAWASQARIQVVAESMGMEIPATKDVFMLKV